MTNGQTPGMMVDIYRSGRRAELYLYVPGRSEPDELSDELMRQFGRATRVMSLWLGPETRLARADAQAVIAALEDKGWYLQLPPGEQRTEAALAALADSLTRAAGQHHE